MLKDQTKDLFALWCASLVLGISLGTFMWVSDSATWLLWLCVLLPPFLTAPGIVAVNVVSRRLAWKRKVAEDQQAREIEQSRQATCRDIAVSVVDRLVTTHSAVLFANYQKKVYTDDYGRKLEDKWNQELDYFYDNIVKPEMVTELRARNIDVLEFLAEYDSPLFRQIIFDYITNIIRDAETVTKTLNISSMSSAEYERYCAGELKAGGWDSRVVAGAGDQGVDIVASRANIIAVFQCKLYSTPLGNAPVQEIHAGRGFYNAGLAAVVSNADYTPGARAAARQTGVILLHHSQLRQFGNKEGQHESPDGGTDPKVVNTVLKEKT